MSSSDMSQLSWLSDMMDDADDEEDFGMMSRSRSRGMEEDDEKEVTQQYKPNVILPGESANFVSWVFSAFVSSMPK